jgi:hypothetical protein
MEPEESKIRDLRVRADRWARANPLLLGAIIAGLGARILYWAVTNRVLDDAYITIKHAKNLADGFGLTHHLGEGGPVHGFTSVLSVLIPIPGELVADGGGLLVLRLVSLVAFVATAVYAHRICRRVEIGPWPTALVLAYLALDQNQIFYGVAGMETQVATAILLAGIYYVFVADTVKAGVLVGLALLARPDFILWVAPALIYLIIRERRSGLRALSLAALVVLPWVIFATIYYGSPVPNTIIAKQQLFPTHLPGVTDIGGWFDFAWNSLKAHQTDWTTWTPFAERFFILHMPLPEFVLKAIGWTVGGLAIVGAFTAWRRWPGLRAAIAFVVLWAAYRVAFLTVGYFEWYGVPIVAVIVIFAAIGLWRLTQGVRVPTYAVAIPASLLALAYAMHIPFTLPLEARVQHDIEDKVRQPLGQYLGEVAKPGDTIVAEPSGYIGYYTNATLLDYPGLTSTRVTDALAGHPELESTAGYAQLFHPDWLALRPWELDFLRNYYPDTAKDYEVVKEFSVPASESSLDRWGLSILNVDRDFIVLHRRSSAES